MIGGGFMYVTVETNGLCFYRNCCTDRLMIDKRLSRI
jgi:hypothetical protein